MMITKEEIIAQEEKLYIAIKERNIDQLDILLHDDLLFIIPDGTVITKSMDIQSYREGNILISSLKANRETINIIDDLAIVTLTMHLEGTFHNTPFDANYRYIRFWKKSGGRIQVVGGSGTSL